MTARGPAQLSPTQEAIIEDLRMGNYALRVHGGWRLRGSFRLDRTVKALITKGLVAESYNNGKHRAVLTPAGSAIAMKMAGPPPAPARKPYWLD